MNEWLDGLLGARNLAEATGAEWLDIEAKWVVEAMFLVVVACMGAWKGLKLSWRCLLGGCRLAAATGRGLAWCVRGSPVETSDHCAAVLTAFEAPDATYFEASGTLCAGGLAAKNCHKEYGRTIEVTPVDNNSGGSVDVMTLLDRRETRLVRQAVDAAVERARQRERTAVAKARTAAQSRVVNELAARRRVDLLKVPADPKKAV